jgi:hypothetical protein
VSSLDSKSKFLPKVIKTDAVDILRDGNLFGVCENWTKST